MHEVRKATPRDVIGIRDVATKAWYNTYLNIYAAKTVNEFLAASYDEQQLYKRLDEQLFLVVEDDEDIIGFANFINGKELFLAAHYVKPNYQYHGYGKALLSEGLSYFKGQYDAVYLEVNHQNDAAVRFYQHQGFELVRTYEHVLYGESFQLALLRKPLN
ncbi:ribosomal protein S18 acetylase RimI-like enzyme [Staphylococcus auricularis]|uniref:GNAT family N-acetyltransferase n=1 Tax=Staphylococcus auricularis TaxID=29379 RepID=UPI001931F08E|nr:GNAT family N-acetyltransferase [Staphylococcus auricularis]MBM0867463.1 GNAT family N-acetyltransferase [Staphylococcus auricularis]MCG7341565.1 GNAT family N-acetyltransferase [Staphylococcus auricularis]